jgi:hypothetical protein
MTDYENVAYVWDYLIEAGLFTEAELQLVTCINGLCVDVLNCCIYVRYGYRDLGQLIEAEAAEMEAKS